jgi:threonine dehydrogenase-like Zn-dependent dehydrogenase
MSDLESSNNYGFYLTGDSKISRVPLMNSAQLPTGWVSLKVSHCGICGTDLDLYHGNKKTQYPMPIGHEFCGTILKKSSDVADLNIGDFVGVDLVYSCGKCSYCLGNMSHFCPKMNCGLFSNRGFSTSVDLHKQYVMKLPEFANCWVGALLEPLSCAIHAVNLSTSDLSKKRILVLGAGSLGMLVACYLSEKYHQNKQNVNSNIFITDINKIRSKVASKAFGIKTIDISDLRKEMFSVVFEVSGQREGFLNSIDITKKGGEIIVLSRNYGKFVLPIEQVQNKELGIKWSHISGPKNCKRIAVNVLLHNIHSLQQCTKIHPLSDLEKLLKSFNSRNSNKIIVDCSV